MFTADSVGTPLERLLRAYDQAISACREQRAVAAYRAVTLLRDAHPCDSPAAAGFDGIYAWCERSIGSGDFLGAARTLDQLRSAWETADRITSPPALDMTVTSRTQTEMRTPSRHEDDSRGAKA